MSAPVRNRGIVLSDRHTDETHGIIVGITKQVVETVQGASLGNPKYAVAQSDVPGGYLETQALNKMRSITICSKIAQTQAELDALTVTIPGRVDFPWPNTLRAITLFRGRGITTETASGAFTNVTVGGGFTFSGGAGIDMADGPRSKSVSSMVRTFSLGVPTISQTITKIQTSSGFVISEDGSQSDYTTYTPTGTVDDLSLSSRFSTTNIPSCLTNSVTINNSGSGASAGNLVLTASIPLVFVPGDVIIASVEVIQWRFGLFVKEVTSITRP